VAPRAVSQDTLCGRQKYAWKYSEWRYPPRAKRVRVGFLAASALQFTTVIGFFAQSSDMHRGSVHGCLARSKRAMGDLPTHTFVSAPCCSDRWFSAGLRTDKRLAARVHVHHPHAFSDTDWRPTRHGLTLLVMTRKLYKVLASAMGALLHVRSAQVHSSRAGWRRLCMRKGLYRS
jgi:hypothetical protein